MTVQQQIMYYTLANSFLYFPLVQETIESLPFFLLFPLFKFLNYEQLGAFQHYDISLEFANILIAKNCATHFKNLIGTAQITICTRMHPNNLKSNMTKIIVFIQERALYFLKLLTGALYHREKAQSNILDGQDVPQKSAKLFLLEMLQCKNNIQLYVLVLHQTHIYIISFSN